jgi:hypothetical protein
VLDRRILTMALVLLLVSGIAVLAATVGIPDDPRDRAVGSGPVPGFDPAGRPIDTTPFVLPTAAVDPETPTTRPRRVFETTTSTTTTIRPNLPPDPRVDPICIVMASFGRMMDEFLLNESATEVPIDLVPSLRAGALVFEKPGGPPYSAMVIAARETADRVEQATSLDEVRTLMRRFTEPTDPALIADFRALYQDTEERCPVPDGPVRDAGGT